MKRLLKYLVTLLLTVLPAACVYDFDPGLEGNVKALIIEGDILAGDITLVQVSNLQSPGVSETAEFLGSGVTVSVESESGAVFPGVCVSGESFDNVYFKVDTRPIDLSSRCRLRVEVPGSGTYLSEWQEILQDESVLDSLYYVVSPGRDQLDIRIDTPGTAEGFYRWIGMEVWEYTAEYRAIVWYDPATNTVKPYENGENYYFCWKRDYFRDILVASAEVQGVTRFRDYTLYSTRNRADLRFYNTYSLTLLQERISREAYDYWTSMRNNTSDVGGLFSPQPSDVRGNIHNVDDPSEYVVGFISASTVSKAQKYYRNTTGHFGVQDPVSTTRAVLKPNLWNNYYQSGYLPLWIYIPDVEEPPVTAEDYYEWAPRRCVDCRLQGGSKNVPADWPTPDK